MKTLKWNDPGVGSVTFFQDKMYRIVAELEEDDGIVAFVCDREGDFLVFVPYERHPAPTLEEAKALAVALVQLNE